MKRLLVIDPVCAQTFGHNLAAMRYFISSAAESKKFDSVAGYCAQNLADSVDGKEIVPFFHFSYHNIFQIKFASVVDHLNVMSDRDYTLRSKADFMRLISGLKLGAKDTLFFPSADYYGIMGVLLAAKDMTVESCPKIILRMIGVLEYTSRVQGTGQPNVLELIRDCLSAGLPIEIVAETPAYASVLSADLETIVHVTPYPVIGDLSPIDPDAPIMIAALGSGRYDKGFLRLKSIFQRVIEQSDGLQLRFLVQNLPHRYASPFVKYIAELSSLPGLHLASDILPQDALADYLRRARVIVSPYAQDVYALRGSAMLMEALSVGRPNVSEQGCGFSSQLLYYDCGTLCQSDEEYAQAILSYVRMDVAELNCRMAQARARFVFDSNSAYARLW